MRRAMPLAAVVVLLAAAGIAQGRGACDRNCMEGIADAYRTAYLKHDPTLAPISRSVRFSENGVMMRSFPDASWDTVTSLPGAHVTLSDVKSGNVGIYMPVVQNDTPGFLAVRLKIRNGEIVEIEHILSTKRNLSSPPTPIGDIADYHPDPNLSAIVPAAQRISRQRLIAHANGYFSTLEHNNGEIRGTRFAPDATRLENGLKFSDIEKSFRQGYYAFNNRVRDRDFFLVDEERQVVMARGFIDHKGVMDGYKLTDGTEKKSVFREPQTWAFLEMFKINDDRIQGVQAVFIQAPYYMPPPWPASK